MTDNPEEYSLPDNIDLESFEIIEIRTLDDGTDVIFMLDKRQDIDKPYCLQAYDNRSYFGNHTEMLVECFYRGYSFVDQRVTAFKCGR